MISKEERGRIEALRRYAIIDTPPEPNFDRLTSLASGIFAHPVCTLALADRDRFWFKSRQGVDATEMPRRMAFCEQTIRGEEVFVVPDAFDDARFAEAPIVAAAPHFRFYAGAPLVTPAGVHIGSLCVLDTRPQRSFSKRKRQILTDLACTAVELLEARSRQIELASCTKEIALLARYDPLTGLANRRHLVEVADRALELMGDDDFAALLYLDLDGFKLVNDTYGHHCGDALLKQVADRLKAAVPERARVARLGGDEFVIVMTGSQQIAAAAEAIAWQLIKRLSADYQVDGSRVKIGASIGLAVHHGKGGGLDLLLREADGALYRAKKKGRGRAVLAGDLNAIAA